MSGEDKARRYVNEMIDLADVRGRVKINTLRTGRRHFVIELVSDTGEKETMIVPHGIHKKRLPSDRRALAFTMVKMRRMIKEDKR